MSYTLLFLLTIINIAHFSTIDISLSAVTPDWPFMSTINIGSANTAVDVYFDTTLDYSFVKTKLCTTCSNKSPYACGTVSTSCTTTATPIQEEYYGMTIQGYEISDEIQLGKITFPLSFIGIIDAPNIDMDLQGVVGLGIKEYLNSKSMINSLISSGLIQSAVIGLSMNEKETVVTLGGYNKGKMKKKNIVWLDAVN